jgi:hypothetical protein
MQPPKTTVQVSADAPLDVANRTASQKIMPLILLLLKFETAENAENGRHAQLPPHLLLRPPPFPFDFLFLNFWARVLVNAIPGKQINNWAYWRALKRDGGVWRWRA